MVDKSVSKRDTSEHFIKLMKDRKLICRTRCKNPPFKMSTCWAVDIVKRSSIKKNLSDFPQFALFPALEDDCQKFEWNKFLSFLYNYNKVAVVQSEGVKMYLFPSEVPRKTDEDLCFSQAVVAYELKEAFGTSVSVRTPNTLKGSIVENATKETPHWRMVSPDAFAKGSSSGEQGTCSSISKCPEAVNSLRPSGSQDYGSTQRNFVRADPSYLKTLGQAHSSWIFGAIAELVDNSWDAKASRIDIDVQTIYDKIAGCEIPLLSIIDDGDGMNHEEILRMVSFGHKQPDEDSLDRIGRFGVGFKTGSMRLGKDALVLTQTTKSRSIAFLSQSLNAGKDNLEIPIVSYRRQAQFMDFDTNVQSEASATDNLKAIKEFSPFNEYLIGEKAGLFHGNTGTQIYIWNLDKWGSDYSLEWVAGIPGGSSFHQGDILVRSRRVRTRPGQTSRKVHLDYSLRAYLEVIFLVPRMKIYVQGSQVKSHPLAKSLNNTAVISGEIMGKPVQLTLGRSQLEWDEGNGGVFLYWHGRLIEAYKRVGGMIHSADMGRGVIGVIDVTELMDDGNSGVWVHSNKQGFQDCEPYACLEEWLGSKADEYWDKFYDVVLLNKTKARCRPDNEWVQCEKCRKWRMLDGDFDSKNLPRDWFCYMEPFNGRCEMPEQKPGQGVITVGTKRSGYDCGVAATGLDGIQIDKDSSGPEGKCEDDANATEGNDLQRPLKRLRRGLPRLPAKKLAQAA